MRLICPNCGAQYEVDASVIPDGGRDVQCSNCGHTWFQRPANQDRELADEMGLDLPEEQDSATEELAETEDEQGEGSDNERGTDPDHLPEDEFADAVDEDADHLPEDDKEDEDDEDGETVSQEFKRRELDPNIADILREEAERETAERSEERSGLEMQPDLGLDSGEESDAVRDRMARMRGTLDDRPDGEEDALVASVVAASARRDLLPDIEEINSTLTASSDRDEEDEEEREEKRSRSGFRRGFILAVLVFAVLALIYSYAPRIIDSYPAAEPALSAYVDAVNGLRSWIDSMMQKAVEKLTALLGQVSGSTNG